MVALNKSFVSVVLAVVCAAADALAAPWPAPASFKHATNRLRVVGRGLQLDTFHPASAYETFGAGIDHGISKRADASLEERALAFMQAHLGVPAEAVAFGSGFASEFSDHAFLRQVIDGIPVGNAVANIAFNKHDKVVAIGSSFIKPSSAALEGTFNGHAATLEFLAREDGSLVLTRVMQIRNEETGVWVEAFAQYLVLPIQEEILTQGFETLVDPQDPLARYAVPAENPLAEVNAAPTVGTQTGLPHPTTAGNNAIAFKGTQTNVTNESAPGLVFDYPQDATAAPTVPGNVDAARVNAFYIVNTIHDLSYRYGFTEAAFNFQNNNFGKGGLGNDRVTISVQSTAGVNNADFSTPPDGQSGAMRMFLWDLTSPERDGALENDIVTHENTHGITNRMTGGGTGRCLQTTEAGGWSDSMADWNEKTSAAVPDFVLGQYVINDTAGIRSHPYSTDA
ncbi:Fungalysin metallopeptidase-domain-containing protein [Mycena leptocephala]|nr:Fungalysin metallopeptidase-domain-containing protein [Mycena leptocephala]